MGDLDLRLTRRSLCGEKSCFARLRETGEVAPCHRVRASNRPKAGQTRSGCAYCAAVPIDSKIRVFRSPIHGYGVIAVRDFEPGEVVADVEGVLYREEEIKDDTYCLWVDEDFYLDMVDQT